LLLGQLGYYEGKGTVALQGVVSLWRVRTLV